MSKGRTISLHLVLVSLLLATAAFHAFILPLMCLIAFMAAALVFFFIGGVTSVVDPINGVWEPVSFPARHFASWASRVTSSNNYRKDISGFLRDGRHGVRIRFQVVLAFALASVYVQAFKVVAIFAAALLAFAVYETFFAGHGVVWVQPSVSGAVMGVLWGYAAGLLWLRWRAQGSN